jgi:hypothetical protein
MENTTRDLPRKFGMGLHDLIANSVQQEANSLRCIQFLEEMLSHYRNNGLQIRHWDGRIWGATQPRCRLILNYPVTLRRLCTEARKLADETTYRIWRLYMGGRAAFSLRPAKHVSHVTDEGVV